MKLSYSAASTYETCPAKYRYRYVDRLPTQPSSALAFGDSIHKALYRFHDRPVPEAPSLSDLLEILDAVWTSDGYAEPAEEVAYREHANEVLERYHADNTSDYRIPAALEFRFSIDIEGVTFGGVIDRMDRLPSGGYEIIDYKTNRRLPPQAAVDSDLQLTIYYMAAREVWGIEPETLTLYYLLPGQRMKTMRTQADAEDVRRRISAIAERIEAGRFEPRENPLCGWCDFQHVCPIFRHREETAAGALATEITPIVDEWITLKRKGREVYRRIDELQALINAYCEDNDYRRLYGSDGAAVNRRAQYMTAPDERKLRALLEPLGLWDGIVSVDPKKLGELIESRRLPPDAEDAILASREEVGTRYALFLKENGKARR